MQSPMSLAARTVRHLRISSKNLNPETPDIPFLIFFINSICNLTCEHCFYWRNLNRKDDLTFDEIQSLSQELGRIDNLNLSGGEPFLREEFGEICRLFIKNNKVEQIYVPTNGYFTERTLKQTKIALSESHLKLFVIELSLDGTEHYHNRFRGSVRSFSNAMETYDELVKLQKTDPRLRIHAISTVTSENITEIENLTKFLLERCPAMDHHNIALIRGDRKNPSLGGPELERFQKLVQTVNNFWQVREEKRFGSIVEPMLQWAKIETAQQKRQVIPCRAGVLSGVVYSNGDVSFCETHQPIGNIRDGGFLKLWRSQQAKELRKSICNKDCYCTNEVFLWPSIVFQPTQLVKAYIKSRKTTALETIS